MADKPEKGTKYPGDFVVGQMLEGNMANLRQQVAQIAEQVGIEMLPDATGWVVRFSVPSDTSNREYIVSRRRTSGEWGCSCRGWINHRHCKHLDRVLDLFTEMDTARAEAQLGPSGVLEALATGRGVDGLLK